MYRWRRHGHRHCQVWSRGEALARLDRRRSFARASRGQGALLRFSFRISPRSPLFLRPFTTGPPRSQGPFREEVNRPNGRKVIAVVVYAPRPLRLKCKGNKKHHIIEALASDPRLASSARSFLSSLRQPRQFSKYASLTCSKANVSTKSSSIRRQRVYYQTEQAIKRFGISPSPRSLPRPPTGVLGLLTETIVPPLPPLLLLLRSLKLEVDLLDAVEAYTSESESASEAPSRRNGTKTHLPPPWAPLSC